MNDFTKISYYDLKLEAAKGRTPLSVGRTQEMERFSRIINKLTRSSILVVGQSGIGKTTVLRGWTKSILEHPAFSRLPVVELEVGSLQHIGTLPAASLARYQEAFASLPPCVVVIDDFGQMVYNQTTSLQIWISLLKPLLDSPRHRLILAVQPRELEWIENQASSFTGNFEVVKLSSQPKEEQLAIIQSHSQLISKKTGVGIPKELLPKILELAEKFPTLGQQPKASVQLLDECVAEAVAKASKEVTEDMLLLIVSEKTNTPVAKLNQDEKQKLKGLKDYLKQKVVGQDQSLETISLIVQRAKLGLKNRNRPLGSFLALGPSGVGKTETAKILAEYLYGKPESFLRIDMSEFSEAHTVQRLIGSPPGYVGFDAGGQLTNHLKNNPYSLILLDEVEKAHPKIFDIFLQLLDDGRLTSGQGETVDCTQTIVMATSNLGVEEIITRSANGEDIHDEDFKRSVLLPVLGKYFRTEFLNRFDSLLVFSPLSHENLTDIALLEIKKIEQRVKEHNIAFSISRDVLAQHIARIADPKLGARPVKRFIEEICEGLIAEQLLNR